MKTAKRIMTTLALGMAIAGFTGTAMAEEEKPEADLTVGVYSKYVWRGFELSEDDFVVQPSLTVAYKGFGFNMWGNVDAKAGANDETNWNETDLTLSYDGAAGIVGYGVGYIYYGLEDGAEDSQEIYASVSVDTLLSPSLTVYKDIANYPGWYASLGIGHSFSFSDTVGLDLGLTIGYLDDDADYNEFHDGVISAALPVTVGEYLVITPEVYYVFGLASDSQTAMELASMSGKDDSFLYGGISLSMAF